MITADEFLTTAFSELNAGEVVCITEAKPKRESPSEVWFNSFLETDRAFRKWNPDKQARAMYTIVSTVSPKASAPLVQTRGHELKLVYPQSEPEAHPERFAALDFQHFFLQPRDNGPGVSHVAETAAYCLKNPKWRLSLQTHKLTGLP